MGEFWGAVTGLARNFTIHKQVISTCADGNDDFIIE
jgi:hypothetical protein